MKERIFQVILYVIVIVVILGIPKLRKMLNDNTLRKYVGWCLTGDPMYGNSSTKKLLDSIQYTESKAKIPIKYCISGNQERGYAIKILEHFQFEWARSYFNDELKIVSHKGQLKEEDYFLAALYSFLSEHECDRTFFGNDMYKLISRKDYGSWGVRHFDALYELNDFSAVFHKLLLVSYAGCLNSDSLNWNGGFSQKQYDDIRNVLDANQIEVSRL